MTRRDNSASIQKCITTPRTSQGKSVWLPDRTFSADSRQGEREGIIMEGGAEGMHIYRNMTVPTQIRLAPF